MTTIFLVALAADAAQISQPEAVTVPPASLVSETAANGASMPMLTADGRYVFFVSRAPNLVTNPTSGSYQIFLRDVITSNIVLISATSDGRGGNNHSLLPSVLPQGNLVAFESEATDLIPDDTNGVSDIFVRDIGHRQTWTLTSGNGASRNAMLSANGYIAFESRASDLVADDTNNAQDVFLSDTEPGSSVLVSVNQAGTGSANRGSQLLTITPNGRFVGFWSDATDISSDTTNTTGEVYVRDVQAGVTYCLTKDIQVSSGARRFALALTPDGEYAAIQELNFSFVASSARVFYVNVFSGSVSNIYCCGRPGSGLAISDDGDKIVFPGTTGLYLREMSQAEPRRLVTDVGNSTEPSGIASFLVSRDFQQLWVVMVTNRLGQPHLFSYNIVSNSLVRVSTNAQGAPINAPVAVPFSISESGAVAAFETAATDVAPGDFNAGPDVFLAGGLISRRHEALPPATGVGLGTLHRTAVNANGARVAFLSADSSLALNDTNRHHDLFVRDFRSNVLQSVDGVTRSNSVYATAFAADGASVVFERFNSEEISVLERGSLFRADLRSGQVQVIRSVPNFFEMNPHWFPSVSHDGRWLLVRDGNRIRIADLWAPPAPGQTQINFITVDTRAAGTADANGPSSNPALSLDGEWAVFVSRATDLIAAPGGGGGTGGGPYPAGIPQVFARKVSQGPTRLVSTTANGAAWPTGGTNPVVSANARYVAFETFSDANIYRHDLLARRPPTNVLVCADCSRPAISGDGRFILYYTQRQIYVRDVENGVSEPIGAPGAMDGTISMDGRFVAFIQAGQLYLHDRWNNAAHLLSRNRDGAPANGPSSRPVFSHDGRTVVFQSFASDIVSGDYNGRRDLFIARVLPVDTDGDGIDDDWETHTFGNLVHDGSADGDGDGHTDYQEFVAGTDPLDPASLLRLKATSTRILPGTNVVHELTWNSASGRTYRVQHTMQLASPWMDVGDILTAAPNASAPAPTDGFYRLKLIE